MQLLSWGHHPITQDVVMEVSPLPKWSGTSLAAELGRYVSSTYFVRAHANQSNTHVTLTFTDVDLACWELEQAEQLSDFRGLVDQLREERTAALEKAAAQAKKSG